LSITVQSLSMTVTKYVMHKKMKSLMSDKNNTDSSVVELKGKTYSISKLGSQADICNATTRAIGECGKRVWHEMTMLVLYGKEQHLQLKPLMPV
jgi:hypothetical protein